MINVALIGNPNTGKTTVFNKLTGSNQYVGNWPGVTIDKKHGFLKEDIKITDLPGIYAMDTFSNEEIISKNFLKDNNVNLIVNVIDSTNLERNLYLTTQLMEFNKPIIILLNMIDIAEKRGINIDTDILEEKLNVRIIKVSAKQNKGFENLEKEIRDLANKKVEYNIKFDTEEQTYKFLNSAIKDSLEVKNKSKYIGEKIDKIVLNPILAYPLFILALFLVFKFTFSWFGQPLADMVDYFVADMLTPFVEGYLINSSDWFRSMIIDGIIAGVGGVIVFFPLVFALFLGISFLEDSGYMSRVAFLMDRIMRSIGLSGKAFIPLIMGFGCSAPAIMATRTLESEKDRKITALIAPLVTCGARLPVYALFAQVFFSNHQESVMMALYLSGIVIAILVGLVFKNTIFRKDDEPFILELPEYKMPSLKSMLMITWDKSKGFIVRAGTLIFGISIIIWFLTFFNMGGYTENIDESFLAMLGGLIAPLFSPLGFGNWQASVSVITGLAAKEVIIGTMEIVYGDLETVLPMMFTHVQAISFLLFASLYTPCFAVIGVMKKEYGNKMMWGSIIYQFTLAWIVAYLFNFFGQIFTIGLDLKLVIEFLIFLVAIGIAYFAGKKYLFDDQLDKISTNN